MKIKHHILSNFSPELLCRISHKSKFTFISLSASESFMFIFWTNSHYPVLCFPVLNRMLFCPAWPNLIVDVIVSSVPCRHFEEIFLRLSRAALESEHTRTNMGLISSVHCRDIKLSDLCSNCWSNSLVISKITTFI